MPPGMVGVGFLVKELSNMLRTVQLTLRELQIIEKGLINLSNSENKKKKTDFDKAEIDLLMEKVDPNCGQPPWKT